MPIPDEDFQDMTMPPPQQEEGTPITGETNPLTPPPSKPKGAPITGLLSLVEKGVYSRVGIPADIAARYDDPEARKLLADTLESLGMPKMLMNTSSLSPTMRIALIAALLGGYGYLIYSQAKVLREAMLKVEAAQKQPLHPEKESSTMKPAEQPEEKHEHSIPDSGAGTPGATSEGGSASPSTGGV